MELPGMAELTTLIVIVALAPASLAQEDNTINCTTETNDGQVQQGTQVTQVPTEVTINCNKEATVTPPVLEQVYKDKGCKDTQPLIEVCPDATRTVTPGETYKVVKIKITKLPTSDKSFFIKCEDKGKSCIAEVPVKGSPATGGGEGVSGGEGAGGGGGGGAGSDQQPGGTTGVQTCEQKNRSITVRIPEKGSSARFACETNFTLYPSAADKIFSADCKKQETLKNMARSEAKVDKSQTIFTITADKKPSKKKLCYLCAKAGVSESNPGKPEDYCMIYVESSVRTPFGLGSTLALMLPCVLAALHFT